MGKRIVILSKKDYDRIKIGSAAWKKKFNVRGK
jgi:hypothetical protein